MIEPRDGQRCYEPSHVVLFAHTGNFAGRTWKYGQRVLTCLEHGGQILTARHHLHDNPDAVAAWLHPYRTADLPLPKLPEHAIPSVQLRPRPWQPPSRIRRKVEA